MFRVIKPSYGRQVINILLLFTLPVLGLPVQVEQNDSVLVKYGDKTLLEAEALESADLEALKKWLTAPPKQVEVRAEGTSLLGLPVKLVISNSVAQRWKSEPKGLATLFAQRLNKLLSNTTPEWDQSGKVVPLGESRVVSLSPYRFEDQIQVTSDNPEVVEVKEVGEGKFQLRGLTAGRASLSVSSTRSEAIPSLPVSVQPWAARWGEGPRKFTFWGELKESRIRESLARWLSARTVVGAKVDLEEVETKDGRAFKARATAEGALSVEKTFPLEVQSQAGAPLEPSRTVFLSNHPERLVSDGVLFERTAPATPVRFMWHHRNEPGSADRSLVLQLSNPTGVTRRVRMLWYSYGPSPDEIHVGHTAALDYAAAAVRGWGEEIVLPAQGTRTIEIRSVKGGQTASGMAYLTDLAGSVGPIGVKVLASSGGGPLPVEPAAERDPGRTASGVFSADIKLDASHLLGGPFTYLEFGGEPYEKDLDKGYPSYGNFGTVYRARLMLKNPLQEEKEAVVGFASGGGAARGVLALDGEIYNLPMGTSGEGLPVRKYLLAPGEVRQVDVELFPQAGSNYPVRIVVKSDYARLEKTDIEPLRPLRSAIP